MLAVRFQAQPSTLPAPGSCAVIPVERFGVDPASRDEFRLEPAGDACPKPEALGCVVDGLYSPASPDVILTRAIAVSVVILCCHIGRTHVYADDQTAIGSHQIHRIGRFVELPVCLELLV